MNFEIFISYKHTDENGVLTKDYSIAKQLYEKLQNKGYNVFFSSNSLEKLGSSLYKQDIDKALDTSKIMIVVLSKAEYASSKWIQYEWDSFYNDYLSKIKEDAHLFTFTSNVDINNLPRTLRNVQNFKYEDDFNNLLITVENALPKCDDEKKELSSNTDSNISRFNIISGKEITKEDIQGAISLDAITYIDDYRVQLETCWEWFNINPDIYVMAKDKLTNKIVAYINITPIDDDNYDEIKNGQLIDSKLTSDMILSYDFPSTYSVIFSSIVIHPDYRNSEVFFEMINAVIKKFIYLSKHEVYIKRMIADAVSIQGVQFCRLFGMKKIHQGQFNSTIYEITMMPPQFKTITKSAKILYEHYLKKYNEDPDFFDN